MPTIRSLENVFLHRNSEAISVVFRRSDGWFILSTVLDPGFEFLVPSVGANAVYGTVLVASPESREGISKLTYDTDDNLPTCIVESGHERVVHYILLAQEQSIVENTGL
jgi:hypothetical protein